MNTMRRFLLCCAFACASAPVSATSVIPANLGELSREALMIARGRVVALDARWTDDHRRVETVVTLEAETYLKGAFGPVVQFRVPGGRLGRYRSILVGAPEFLIGQRVVVFLAAHGPAVPFVLGLGQGVFRIVPGDEGWIVRPPAILPAAGGPVGIVRGDPARRPLPLADFERQVRVLAGAAQ
jgi:hypothetical protein